MQTGTGNSRRRESAFFVTMSAVMAVIVFVGFARSLYLPFLLPPDPLASSDAVYLIHGVIASAWIALFVIQPNLVRAGQIKRHRRYGWIGVGVAGMVVISGLGVSVAAAARLPGDPLPTMPLGFLGVILFGLLLFGVLVGCAVGYRQNGPAHKRLMYLATINLLQAAIVRIPVAWIMQSGPMTSFWLAAGLIVPLLVWDLASTQAIHRATLCGGLAIVASIPVRVWITSTPQWASIAERVVQVVRG